MNKNRGKISNLDGFFQEYDVHQLCQLTRTRIFTTMQKISLETYRSQFSYMVSFFLKKMKKKIKENF